MLGDLRLKDLKISVKEYQELNKNASAMQVAMILTHSEELERIFNPFLNRFEDDELYQVFYLLCRYIDECYEDCEDDEIPLLYDFIYDNAKNIIDEFIKIYCEEEE